MNQHRAMWDHYFKKRCETISSAPVVVRNAVYKNIRAVLQAESSDHTFTCDCLSCAWLRDKLHPPVTSVHVNV